MKKTVNYVWISPEHDNDQASTEGPISTLNHTFLDLVFNNAEKYPHAEFILWVDYESLDNISRFFLETHAYLMGTENIKIADLRSIPIFANDPVFQTGNGIKIKAKADYARIVVMNHCLHEAEDGTQIFYSDMDAQDVEINSSTISNVLNATGIGCAATIDGLENSFIALRASEPIRNLIENLMEQSKKAAQRNAYSRYELVKSVEEHGGKSGYKIPDFFCKKMPNMGEAIPTNPDYIECGLN